MRSQFFPKTSQFSLFFVFRNVLRYILAVFVCYISRFRYSALFCYRFLFTYYYFPNVRIIIIVSFLLQSEIECFPSEGIHECFNYCFMTEAEHGVREAT